MQRFTELLCKSAHCSPVVDIDPSIQHDKNVITYPLHGAEFCLSDGKGLGSAAYRPLTVYQVAIENGTVAVLVRDQDY